MLPKQLKRASLAVVVLVLAVAGALLVASPKLDSNPELARKAQARAELRLIDAALHEFAEAHGAFPTNEQSLRVLTQPSPSNGSALRSEAITDPWGRPYQYRFVYGSVYELYSLGPNGRDDRLAGDDISLEKR